MCKNQDIGCTLNKQCNNYDNANGGEMIKLGMNEIRVKNTIKISRKQYKMSLINKINETWRNTLKRRREILNM